MLRFRYRADEPCTDADDERSANTAATASKQPIASGGGLYRTARCDSREKARR
jgi:hypothetical protein